LRGRCGWRAASKLSSTNCCRTRWMVERLTPNASAMASSGYRMPSGLASACSKMRPWSNLRAAPLPDDTIFRSTQRSSSVRVTRNLAMGELLLLKPQIRGEKENRLGSTCQSKIAKLLGALHCTESHGNNQCQRESPLSAFWTDPLRILYAPDTLEVCTSLPAPCRHHPRTELGASPFDDTQSTSVHTPVNTLVPQVVTLMSPYP